MNSNLKRAALAGGAVAALVGAGLALAARSNDERDCPTPLPVGSEPVKLDPADFTIQVDNPYWPMAPGSRWVYRETDGEGNEQRVVVRVSQKTKTVAAGIEARIVHDVVTQNGQPIEVTQDWYAQDRCGNVWYLGEQTTEYSNGVPVTTAGSWEAGVDGALAGVMVPAEPSHGLAYRQEYYKGEAEDGAAVLSVEEQAEVPFGHFTGALLTKDFSPLHPEVLEYKLYARDVGPVLVLGVSGGVKREELVRFTKPA